MSLRPSYLKHFKYEFKNSVKIIFGATKDKKLM
jgi:hypothetical protein